MNIDVEVPCTVLTNRIQRYIKQQFLNKWDFFLECKMIQYQKLYPRNSQH